MSMLLRSRLLGGVWSFASFAPDGVAGGAPGGAPGGGDGGAAAGAGGAGGAVKVPAAGAGGAPGGGPAGSGSGEGSPAGAGAGAGAATLAGGAAAGAAPAAPQAKWPDNWREELAGGDQAKLNILKRYDSPGAFAAGGFELRGKLDRGELKAPPKPLPADATPEQQLAWRKEHGIPETPDAYFAGLKLGEGVVVGEADKPLVESFLKNVAHARNWTQEQANEALGWYYAQQDQLIAQRDQADGAFKQEATVALTQEWGKDFQANVNVVSSVVQMFPEDFREALLTARTEDGKLLGNHPQFNRALLMLGKELNPAAALLPNAASGGLTSVESRIAEIETKFMRAPQGSPEWSQYWKGAAMQEEYRGLLDARSKMQERAKVA